MIHWQAFLQGFQLVWRIDYSLVYAYGMVAGIAIGKYLL